MTDADAKIAIMSLIRVRCHGKTDILTYIYLQDVDPEQGIKIGISSYDPDAPAAAKVGGHGTSEYYLIKDFLHAIKTDTTPAIDIVKGMDMTVPGLIAHEAAKKGGVWLDVPRITD